MKIQAFYYLGYPNDCPLNPRYAQSVMYVETGDDDAPENVLIGTWSFDVYTIDYAQDKFFRHGLPLAGRSVLIVPEIGTEWMENFLDANVENIEAWGTGGH